MPNTTAFNAFDEARVHYCARRFDAAQAAMQRYRQRIDYVRFTRVDSRRLDTPIVSVVIVTFATGNELIACLKSVLAQQGPSFEIILVDNGGNESVHNQLEEITPILWVKSPHNLLPSEGRNIGAHFARGDYLVFLDDDAIMCPGYLAVVQTKALENKYLALRGRILPKSSNAPPAPKHYDLGQTEKPCEFNLEGNMVVRRNLFQMLGGFDPLMFGHEGKALTQQWHTSFPENDIRYCPDLIIRHDWAKEEDLTYKKSRQALGKKYLDYLKENQLNAGISIILCAGDKLAEAQAFLEEFNRNTYKSIEILLWAKDTQHAVELIRPHMAKFYTRVLSAAVHTVSSVAQACSYDNCLIVDLSRQMQAHVLKNDIQQNEVNMDTFFSSSSSKFTELGNISVNATLDSIALNSNRQDKTQSLNDVQKNESISLKTNNKKQEKCSQKNFFNIDDIKYKQNQINQEIEYLIRDIKSMPSISSDRQSVKDHIKRNLLTSSRLSLDLMCAQKNG